MGLTSDDRLDIHEVVVRYGHVLDDRDWPGFARVFTDDAVVDFSSKGPPPTGLAPIVGLEEIVHQFRDVLLHPLQHIIANHIIDVVSDNEVVVRSKALFPIPDQLIFEGLYRDVVVRNPDGWRISQKSISTFNHEPLPWATANFRRMRERGATFL